MSTKIKQLLISISLLILAILGAWGLYLLKKPPAKEQVIVLAPLVEVEQLEKKDRPSLLVFSRATDSVSWRLRSHVLRAGI